METEKVKNYLNVNELNKKKILMLASGLIISLLVLAGSSLYYIDSQELEKQSRTQNVSFTVVEPSNNSNQTNINVETGNHLNFGEMPNGTNQRRYIRWNSSSITLATISVTGNASEYLEFDEVVAFQGQREYEVEMVSESTGYYEGVMKIKFEAPRTRRALKWLEIKRRYFY